MTANAVLCHAKCVIKKMNFGGKIYQKLMNNHKAYISRLRYVQVKNYFAFLEENENSVLVLFSLSVRYHTIH